LALLVMLREDQEVFGFTSMLAFTVALRAMVAAMRATDIKVCVFDDTHVFAMGAAP
jgi:hypothetical protein